MLASLLVPLLAFAPTSPLQEFYTVSAAFSDNGGLFYYRILHVTPDGADTIVRYIHVTPLAYYCPRFLVQAKQVRIPNQPPSHVAAKAKLCAIDPTRFRSTVRQYRKAKGGLEMVSHGVVAQCGASRKSFAVPYMLEPDLERLAHDHPQFASLWTLPSEIGRRVFGETDIFYTKHDELDFSLQQGVEKFLPDLIAGRFDEGLALAYGRNPKSRNAPTFRNLLSGYHGPVDAAAAQAARIPKLLAADTWRFLKYSPPVYSPLALHAHIEAQVELELTIDPATGNVAQVKPISGHPLLTPAAESAAKTWQVVPDSTPPTARLTLDFTIRCP